MTGLQARFGCGSPFLASTEPGLPGATGPLGASAGGPATPRGVRAAPRRRRVPSVPSRSVIDDATVRHVARLARLRLEQDEEKRMRTELSVILEHVEALQDLDLDDVEPTAHVQEMSNVLRDDVPRPGLTADEALREAPATLDGRFGVPRFE